MRFNKDHKIIIASLDEAEARAFVKFLGSEIIRHYDDIVQAWALMEYVEKEKLGDANICK